MDSTDDDQTGHDQTQGGAKSGPALSNAAPELQGLFPSDAALQDAISRLALLGVDRADMTVPDPTVAATSPEAGSQAAPSHVDTTQIRTMASGITGTAAGMAVGAVVATGGLAAPLVAAAAGVSALGAAAATTGLGIANEQAGASTRDQLGREGKLMLAVRVRDEARAESAASAMRDAGATSVNRVNSVDDALTRGVAASSWTGD